MKLLYKGSECGVPCTCPSAEEEYVWWKYADELSVGNGTNPYVYIPLSVPIVPIGYRVTNANGDLYRLYVYLYNASNKMFAHYEWGTDTLFSGQDIILYVPEVFLANQLSKIQLSFANRTGSTAQTITDVQILVSKSDYAKLVEASGS